MNVASPPRRPIASAAILSPHRDDAAFSCGLLLTLLLRHSIPVTIVNVFTVSDYAPFAHPAVLSSAEITEIRRTEDQQLLARLGPGSHLCDLAELDAPLRLGITAGHVLADPHTPGPVESRIPAEILRLAPRLNLLQDFDLVLLPLALGHHVDHRIARDAGRLAAPPGRTAFYQDLPYASRFAPAGRQQRIADHAAGLGPAPLTPLDLPFPGARQRKQELAALYTSQVAPEVVLEIAAYADSLAGAERLYAPAPLARALEATLHLEPLLAPGTTAPAPTPQSLSFEAEGPN